MKKLIDVFLCILMAIILVVHICGIIGGLRSCCS
jgi:hypothetical protein